MTNELAIAILTGDVLGTIEQTQEAVTMAVRALSQPDVPDTNVGDMISRQAAIDAILTVNGNSSVRELYEHVQEHGLSDMWSGGVNAAIDIIIAVPSAQPGRERGEWTDDNACPFCSFQPWYERDIHTLSFCPNCGADMRGEQE